MQEYGRPVFQHQAYAVADSVAGGRIPLSNGLDRRCRLAVSQRAGSNAVVLRRLRGDVQEGPLMPDTRGLPECRGYSAAQSGSQSNTSPERSSGIYAAFSAGAACAAMVSGVQPSA
jgi:hypothetical protein